MICGEFSERFFQSYQGVSKEIIPPYSTHTQGNSSPPPWAQKISHLIPLPNPEGVQIQYLFSDGTILNYRQLLRHPFHRLIDAEWLLLNQTGISQAEKYRNARFSHRGEDLEIALIQRGQKIQKAQSATAPKRKISWYLCHGKSTAQVREALPVEQIVFSGDDPSFRYTLEVSPAPEESDTWQRGSRRLELKTVYGPGEDSAWDFIDTHLFYHRASKTLGFSPDSSKLNTVQKTIEDLLPYDSGTSWSSFKEGPAVLHGHRSIDRLVRKLTPLLPVRSEDFELLPPESYRPRLHVEAEGQLRCFWEAPSFQVYWFPKKIENILKGFSEGLGYFFGNIHHGVSKTKRRKYELLFFSHRGYYGYVVHQFLKHFLSSDPLPTSVFHKKISGDLAMLIDRKLNPGRFLRQETRIELRDVCNGTIVSFFENFIETLQQTFESSDLPLYLRDKNVLLEMPPFWARLVFELMEIPIRKTKAACFEKKTTPLLQLESQGTQEILTSEGNDYNPPVEGLRFAGLSAEEICLALFRVKRALPSCALYQNGQPLEALNERNFKAEFSLQTPAASPEGQDLQNSTRDLNWFELHPKFFLNGEEIPEDLVRDMNEKGVLRWQGKLYLVEDKELPSIQYLEKFWNKLRSGQDDKKRRKISDSIYPLAKNQTLELLWLRSQGVTIHGNDVWRKICELYDNSSTDTSIPLPPSLHATLKPYQHIGVRWLYDLYELGLGGILADDMGLGKTLQSLAFFEILRLQKTLSHALVIVPTSLTYNWFSECRKFTPELPVHIFSSKNKTEASRFLRENPQGLMIVSYGLFVEHAEYFKTIVWNIQLYDEAQNLKNITAARTNACRAIPARFKLCLTGTPLENHLGEFYSLMDLVVPGALGGYEDFRKIFINPPSIPHEEITKLRQKTKPLILRRTKAEILKELPEKTESSIELIFEEKQKKIYRDIAVSWNERVKDSIEQYGEAKSQMMMLTALLRLRQTCSDPASLPKVKYDAVPPKIATLIDSLEEVTESGESALVFTQFLSTYHRILKMLTERKIPVFSLNGTTTREARQKNLQAFDAHSGGAVMLMTLKSGGVGLNLTKASYVFHIEPWWNPAVENQASDRAHRLGQTRKVQIFRYLMKDSVEEKIEILKERKKARFEALFGTTQRSHFDFESLKDLEGATSRLTREDFNYLIQPS